MTQAIPPVTVTLESTQAPAWLFTWLGSVPRLLLILASCLYPLLAKIGIAPEAINGVANALSPVVIPLIAAVISFVWSHIDNKLQTPALMKLVALIFHDDGKTDPPAMVMGKSLIVLLMAGIALGLSGCADTQTPIVREGIYQGYAPIIAEYKTWMAQKQTAGTLSADDVRIRNNTLSSVDALVTQSRANDGKTFLSGQ